MRRFIGVLTVIVLFFATNMLVRQCNKIQAEHEQHKAYIAKYWPEACKLQRQYRVPAYLLIAIGMADSEFGTNGSNNHFSIVLHENGQDSVELQSVEHGYHIMARLIAKSLPETEIPYTDVRAWCMTKMSYNRNETEEYKDRLYRLVKLHNLDKLDTL